MHQRDKVNSTGFYLILLLVGILLDEILDNYFLGIFGTRPMPQKAVLYGFFLLVQVVMSPLQAGFSDFYCRKRSLIASLGCSAISLILMIFYFKMVFLQTLALPIAALIKAAMGNTLPLAWAGIADTRKQNYRFSLGLSTSVIAVGYLVIIIMDAIFKEQQSLFIILFLFLCLILIFHKKFFDLIDRKSQREAVSHEIGLYNTEKKGNIKYFFKLLFLDYKSIWKNFLKCKRFRTGLFGVFFLVEISFYSMHALGVDLSIKGFTDVTILMIAGYICGVCMLRYYKDKSDEFLINKGYKISIVSFLPIFILNHFFTSSQLQWMIAPCYFIYSFGVAFIVPSLFSSLSRERKVHEQGKIYGLIDSTDTIALFLALIIGILYSYVKKNIFIIYFSFFIFLISRLCYARFNRTKKSES